MTFEELIALCHEQAHEAEHDYEDTAVVAITRREVWLILLSLVLLSYQADCLGGDAMALRLRLAELIDSQCPHWRDPRYGSEET